MAKDKNKLPESVTLEDGRVITKRNPTVREIVSVGTYARKDEDLKTYLMFSIKILVDGKTVSFEKFLDGFHESDLEAITSLFVSEDDIKNILSQ